MKLLDFLANMIFFYNFVKHKLSLANGEVNFLFPSYCFLLKVNIEKFLKQTYVYNAYTGIHINVED